MHLLAGADLVVVFTRFMKLPDDELPAAEAQMERAGGDNSKKNVVPNLEQFHTPVLFSIVAPSPIHFVKPYIYI